MFSSALKSISSTKIGSHYTVASTPTCTAGPWKVYEGKRKSTGQAVSVFVFDRRALDAHGNSLGLGRAGTAAYRRSVDAVVDRLRREASSLARLRHPSVLELVEPVEDTRGGGLQFATEAVTGSLGSAMNDGSSSGTNRRRRDELDVLELQKGLLQLGKALEFLHETAGLVHGNVTPDAVLINAKSDWKISGLGFSGPRATTPSPVSSIDPSLPATVQASLDYAAPEAVLDGQLSPAADLYALGLLCVALYSAPQRSPLAAHGSVTAYRRLLADPSTTPRPENSFLASRPLPRELAAHVLPRLLARQPAQRMSARAFQTSEYFDNVLVSTIRFLDGFPAKTPAEKGQFLRGLRKVLPSFPRAVVEKKLLPALLDELKDRQLAPAMLHNVFAMIDLLAPTARRPVSERVLPALKTLFAISPSTTPATAATAERDPARDASLMAVLEHLSALTANTTGKEFKDDVLPIVATALESPAPAVVDAALRSIPVILPILDFSTIKHELFPVVGTIFSKTSSLAIKIRGLQAFVTLCGGSADGDSNDGLDGLSSPNASSTSSSALDKYTMQDKIVPLIRAIRTKEPAVMMESLRVLRVIGGAADTEFVALEILPILWTMALGPLLNLQQFQAFMKLIRALSSRVEDEQVKKLQELSAGGVNGAGGSSAMADAFSGLGGSAWDATTGGTGGDTEDDFTRLVKGETSGGGGSSGGGDMMDVGWDAPPQRSPTFSNGKRTSTSSATPAAVSAAVATPTFSWSTTPTPKATPPPPVNAALRTVTPDLHSFPSMVPSSTQFSQALPARPMGSMSSVSSTPNTPSMASTASTTNTTSSLWSAPPPASTPSTSGINWSMASNTPSLGQLASTQARTVSSSFSLPPPPGSTSPATASFRLPPPPGNTLSSGMAALSMQSSAAPNYDRSSLGLGQSSAQPSNMGMGTGMGTGTGMGMGMGMGMSMNSMSMNSMNSMNSTNMGNVGMNTGTGSMMPTRPGKTGLDKYESLL